MEPLVVRELTQVQTLVFEHEDVTDVALLLRLLADYCEASDATLLAVTYANEDAGGFRERITAHVECPWQS